MSANDPIIVLPLSDTSMYTLFMAWRGMNAMASYRAGRARFGFSRWRFGVALNIAGTKDNDEYGGTMFRQRGYDI